MPDLEQTLSLAKRGKISRAEVYASISALAEQRREPGQSEAQAFTRFIATPEGSELYRIQKSLPGRDVDAAWQPPAAITKSAGSGEWHDLVDFCRRAHKRSHPHATENQANAAAVNAALSTSGGMHLFQMQKRSEMISSGGFSKADLECLDKAQPSVSDAHVPASGHEYETLVEDAMVKFRLTRSGAHDYVLSTPKGGEAWRKFKGVPGQNGLPQDEGEASRAYSPPSPTSGREGRSPTQWRPQEGHFSHPTTPARIGVRANETPALKAWRDLKRKAMSDYGFSEAKTVEILKLLPAGKRALARVIDEAAGASS
jgi:hypothetical protein